MRVLSGIQPTGKLHIGNYLAAVKNWVKLQENNECIFFIADLHSLTIPYQPKVLEKNVLETAAAHLVLGIDPEKSIFFIQSKIKEHSELAWFLNTICPVGELERMTQYKEKSKQFKKNINAGLLDYPVLQAADILLYEPDIVPVGKDQSQHLELTRELGRKFNKKFGETFKIPKAEIISMGSKIMSLQNPRKKMSKSVPKSCLFIFDEPKTIKSKIMSAVTDTGKIIKYDPKRKPGISNLLIIYSLISEKPIEKLEKEFRGKGYAEFKKKLAKIIIEYFEPFRKKMEKLSKREVYIKEILKQGEHKAKIIAASTMEKVRRAMGLVY